ncbi:cupin-like domain-containing protein [Chroococcidiopsis sp. FACHB-1243]|uniref:cupin-like domain-containing protein n=1 Tax=Chroococcidiopsis sp. [FACHB-1243] TaxID=2692781 RepID=UPI001784AD2C|nr:cupin-like domain-containing protein [Chroococcidiopsis sp. [FACHB-1243]]MBD2309015.1 cupin-like domain-containing protein [Chroococcidiopsis sp. [FACHB-1243]]
MLTTSSEIARHHHLSSEEFVTEYVNKSKPVIISGVIQKWGSFHKWSLQYFSAIAPDVNIYAKHFYNGQIEIEAFTIKKYADVLGAYEKAKNQNSACTRLPYCHDLPLFSLIPSLIQDVQPFPLNYLPEWYAYKWWRYCQFFIGSSHSLTPLHFDCLLTNNLFFQIVGRKQFTILLNEDSKYCYRHNWRWFKVDPEHPDLEQYPLYKNARPIKVIVNPGDILYMPPGTLHHVRSLDESISFNIDWHTEKSALNGVAASLKGMPVKNVYYNLLLALGLVFKVSPQLIFRFYKSYLNYIS